MAKVKLDDVAVEARETWNKDRNDVPVVGLEHLEPDEIWLRQWDVNPDENTFTKGFKKGQLLFGRRRAYQKKMSLAPCDGICSGDITVIAAKPENIMPELLPFYLRTDAFFDFAMRGSGGSLSPRVKWSHISDYEFDLPPMDEQKKLAELLWAANDLKEKYKKAITATDEMLKAKFREMFGDAGDNSSRGGAKTRRGGSHGVTSKHPMVPLEEVCKILTDGTHLPPKFSDSGIPFLFVSNIQNNKLTYETNKYITLEQYKVLIKRTPIEIGDVLLTTVGSYGNPAVVESDKPFCFQRHIAYLKLKRDLIEPNFLHAVLLSEKVRNQIDTAAQGCAQKTVTLTSLRSIQIPLPPLSLQREFVAIADKAESAKANLKKSIAAIDQVMKGLING
jgi:type I restriction enzyme S subunit